MIDQVKASVVVLGIVVLAMLGCQENTDPSKQPSVSPLPAEVKSTSQDQDVNPVESTDPPEIKEKATPVTSTDPPKPDTPKDYPLKADPKPRLTKQGAQIISFDDLKLDIKADIVFKRSMLTDKAKSLDGKKVNIKGVMLGSTQSLKGIEKFILIRNYQCKFGRGGQMHHNIRIDLQDGVTASYTTRVIEVEGELSIDPWEGPDGKTWSIYYLKGYKAK